MTNTTKGKPMLAVLGKLSMDFMTHRPAIPSPPRQIKRETSPFTVRIIGRNVNGNQKLTRWS